MKNILGGRTIDKVMKQLRMLFTIICIAYSFWLLSNIYMKQVEISTVTIFGLLIMFVVSAMLLIEIRKEVTY